MRMPKDGRQLKFLLDANISHETATYLRKLGYGAKTVAQFRLGRATDERIARYAAQNKYVVVTFDLDFGYLYHLFTKYRTGVLILRLQDQRVESVNRVMGQLHKKGILKDGDNQSKLIVADEKRIRIRE
jgi:predicted nuclease of predicted toxin-antitoxin system